MKHMKKWTKKNWEREHIKNEIWTMTNIRKWEIDAAKTNAQIMNNYAKMEPTWMPKSVNNRTSWGKRHAENDAEIWCKNLTPAHPAFWFLGTLLLGGSPRKNDNKRQTNNKKRYIWWGTLEDEGQHAQGPAGQSGFLGAQRDVRGGLRLWSSAKTLVSYLTRSAPRNGGGGFTDHCYLSASAHSARPTRGYEGVSATRNGFVD